MCAGCEYVTQQVTQNPTTISTIVGYIASAGMLVLSYAIVFSRKFSKCMHRVILLLAGSGATVAASDSARRGDLLYGVDTAVERVRIAIADEEKKSELQVQFATERAIEAESLIVELEQAQDDVRTHATTTPTTIGASDEKKVRERKERSSRATEDAIRTLRAVAAELESMGNLEVAALITNTRLRLEAHTVLEVDEEKEDDQRDASDDNTDVRTENVQSAVSTPTDTKRDDDTTKSSERTVTSSNTSNDSNDSDDVSDDSNSRSSSNDSALRIDDSDDEWDDSDEEDHND